jgi:hypothetical protein
MLLTSIAPTLIGGCLFVAEREQGPHLVRELLP